MVDFVRCLQNRKLLESGEYIVISVDDEIYNANVNIMERSELYSLRRLNGHSTISLYSNACPILLQIT